MPLSLKNSIESIVSRLVFAASTYFIWQERNNRIYSNESNLEEQVCGMILEVVRLKLTTIQFKKTPKVVRTLLKWKINLGLT